MLILNVLLSLLLEHSYQYDSVQANESFRAARFLQKCQQVFDLHRDKVRSLLRLWALPQEQGDGSAVHQGLQDREVRPHHDSRGRQQIQVRSGKHQR